MKGLTSERPILIVGLGSAGARHFRNLRSLGCSNFVFYRTHKGTLEEPEAAGWPETDNLESALNHHPEIAIIANPTALHVPIAMEIARAGCHLFIEKPLSHTLDGCAELEELAGHLKLVTMVGCQFRFHPLLLTLREHLEDGRIGKVVGARAEWGEYLPGWHPWEDHRAGYSARSDLGGGSILTLIHPLDYLYWLFGEVNRVHASACNIASLQTDIEDDLAELTLEFESGMVGQVHLDYLQRPPTHTLTVWGEDGRADLDYLAGNLRWMSFDGQVQVERVPEGFERNTMFVNEIQHFMECVERRVPTMATLTEGISVLEIALRAKRDALESRQRV